MNARLDAFFMAAADGSPRFALHHTPRTGPVKAGVLYLHPFAEEMNKVRRMAALQARALASAGFAVLQIDLRGCGDSAGELAETGWADWLDDALAGARWLREHHADAPLWLWGARAGCLLAGATAEVLTPTPGLLLWAPVINGQMQLQQFLRIKVAGEMLAGDARGGLAALKGALDAGGTVEIGGYQLPSGLAQGLGQARLRPPAALTRIAWLDMTSRPDATLAPPALQWLNACLEAGHQVHSAAVMGPAFWQTTEIEEAPELLKATLEALQAMAA